MDKRAIAYRNRFQVFMAWKRRAAIAILMTYMPLGSAAFHGQTKSPLTLDQVHKLLSIGAPDATIAHEIESRGAAFQPSVALLNELEREHAGEETLAALRKLIPAEHILCESFGDCMGEGQHAYYDKEWARAREYFQHAAMISPNSSQAWNSLGNAYLALKQTQEAYLAWDNALSVQDGVALTACMERQQQLCEGGTLRITTSTLRLTTATLFQNKGSEKIFEAPLSDVRIIGTIRQGSPSYLAFEMLINGTKYDFDFFPIAVQCVWSSVLVCPAEGQAEQVAMASYFERTFGRLVSGGVENRRNTGTSEQSLSARPDRTGGGSVPGADVSTRESVVFQTDADRRGALILLSDHIEYRDYGMGTQGGRAPYGPNPANDFSLPYSEIVGVKAYGFRPILFGSYEVVVSTHKKSFHIPALHGDVIAKAIRERCHLSPNEGH